MLEEELIEVIGAREHNLKNIDVNIPRNKLVVITGLSGSGKSSLAFDTIYAEGQRRYIETFGAYARQFIGEMERPDVDKINGLSPVISIEQKTVSRNPRSTVGTITEIYDFLRLLYARASDAYSYVTGEKMVRYTDDQIVQLINEEYAGEKIIVLAPLVKGRKGHYRELFESLMKQGYLRARIDGEVLEMSKGMKLDRYKIHDIELVIDRLKVDEFRQSRKASAQTPKGNEEASAETQRIRQTVNTALRLGKGSLMVSKHGENLIEKKSAKGKRAASPSPLEGVGVRFFSRHLMCPTSGISYSEPEPNLFSFNSPYGACPHCNGLGEVAEVDLDKIIPNPKLSIKKGGIVPLGEAKNNWTTTQVEAVLKKFGCDLNTPIDDMDDEVVNAILYGTEELIEVTSSLNYTYPMKFEGIIASIERQVEEETSPGLRRWAESFMNKMSCPECKGSRLKKEALYFRIANKNIHELASMGMKELAKWFEGVEYKMTQRQLAIATEPLKEIRNRIRFLLDVGLEYLTINRSAKTLSGGEAQRIRLATQIGSQLVGVLYILDEPSIGLHQRDNHKLIQSLKNLRDGGNSVIVVEHDRDMMLESDHLIDIGPGAGIHGGRIITEGHPRNLLKGESLTAKYLRGEVRIEIPKERRKGNKKFLILEGAVGHNLKDVHLKIPLGKFVCITGVSGSGKSSLIEHTLYPILNSHYFNGVKKPLEYKRIKGLEHLDKVIEIDQSPIGRTPRSNPSTYTGIFTDIRNLYSNSPESKIRGYQPGRFSFNVVGGRCETCRGAGVKTIEMNFLPDVMVQCETCNGKRYNRETLEIRYKGKSISDILDMTVDHAVEFFDNFARIKNVVRTLQDVGLGYITLGQHSTTLSGGEAQRVKLSTELGKRDTGNTIYILDEPTTGLHFQDVQLLINVLNRLVDRGNTVLVIEHNMDIIKVSDHIIDLGPEGGDAGGKIVGEGTPEEVAKVKESWTGKYLKGELK
ncbi:MAG: excinuclease ABC subunit UvrA [Flavobacteriales bacterium]|mgnify:CR=1 FL=1|nr:excinuclease ABC subunit UvrA [Flavobacteriales bacterium]